MERHNGTADHVNGDNLFRRWNRDPVPSQVPAGRNAAWQRVTCWSNRHNADLPLGINFSNAGDIITAEGRRLRVSVLYQDQPRGWRWLTRFLQLPWFLVIWPSAYLRRGPTRQPGAPWSRVASIGIANIARWKIAGLMSWEAIAGGVVRTRMSSLCRQNLKAQGNVALPRHRHPLLALSGCCPHQRCPLLG